MAASFIAIDGEAIDNAYVLLCRSDGTPGGEAHAIDLADGLHTITCLEFLLAAPKGTMVCFGLGYDVNQWLRDLPRRDLARLWEGHVIYWRDYRIEWVPARWFSVKHLDGRYARVNEVFGFFQTSFVNSLADWGMEPPAELAAMKRARGTFSQADLARVIEYCLSECRLLVELMDRLRDACKGAGALPKSWIGAGSIATALLGRQGMDEHHVYDLDLADEETVTTAVLGAYYGGRVELLHQGIHKTVNTLDLRSAYPAAAATLPSLMGARLVHRRRFKPGIAHGIWRVRWQAPRERLVMPFPVRVDMSIYYPRAGTGCYHHCEVAAAIDAGYDVEVIEGWELVQPRAAAAILPFDWIPRVFSERQKLAARGHPAQKAIKLGLNSIYGKLAQGYGHRSRPRWQSYFWAGEVTARTRARILTALQTTRGAIMVSTDGIFATHPDRRLGTRLTKRLGSWEPGRLDLLFAAQPGVYQGHVAGREVLKSRGFFADEVDYDQLRAGYLQEGAEYVYRYTSRRFIGLGAALNRNRLDLWRQWVDEQRALSLWPTRKHPQPGGTLLPVPGPLDSEPYQPKVSLLDARAADNTDGMEQPLREAI